MDYASSSMMTGESLDEMLTDFTQCKSKYPPDQLLRVFIQFADISYIEKLIEKISVEVLNEVDSKGSTFLIDAAGAGNHELVGLFLNKGVNLDSQSNFGHGNSALMQAAEQNHGTIVQQLLEAGANTRLTNSDGNTALNLAEKNKNLHIVTLLNAPIKDNKNREACFFLFNFKVLCSFAQYYAFPSSQSNQSHASDKQNSKTIIRSPLPTTIR